MSVISVKLIISANHVVAHLKCRLPLYTAVFFWNNWFYPLIYLKADQYPVMLLLRNIVNGGTAITSDGGQSALAISIRSAVILVSTVPIVLLYPFLQKYFVGSIYLGAVKE